MHPGFPPLPLGGISTIQGQGSFSIIFAGEMAGSQRSPRQEASQQPQVQLRHDTGRSMQTNAAGPSAAFKSTAEEANAAIQAHTCKRKREPNESAQQISMEPVWQTGHGIGFDGSIWWKDCNEGFQIALETQYQASVPKVAHECITETGVKVRLRHDIGRWTQTNLSNGIARLLRRIELASPSTQSCFGQAACAT